MIPLLIEAGLRALVAALAVGTALRLLRVRNVLAQKVAWGLVLAASMAMPAMMRWLPSSVRLPLVLPAWLHAGNAITAPAQFTSDQVQILHGSGSASSPAPAVSFVPAEDSLPPGGNRYPAPVVSNGEFSAPARLQFAPAEAGQAQALEVEAHQTPRNLFAPALARLRLLPLKTFAALAYVLICALLLLRLFYGLAVAANLWFNALPVEPGMMANITGVAVRTSDQVFSPVTIGSGVVLPEDFAGWDAEKLRIVLAHERSHIRQGDFYLQMLAGVYAAIFWFSPLGWWLKRQLSDLGEAISDRAGLEEAASRVFYAQVLLEFAAMPRPTLTGVAMARTTNLSHRIERLLNDSIFRQSFAASRRALTVGLLFPLALIAATSLVRVEAAGQAAPTPPPTPVPAVAPAPAPEPAIPQEPLTGVSDPDAAPAPAPHATPVAPPAPVPPAVLATPAAPVAPPPYPRAYGEIHDSADDRAYGQGYSQSSSTSESHDNTFIRSQMDVNGKHVLGNSSHGGYSYSYSSNGDSWAVVSGPNQHIDVTGEWNDSTRAELDKARKLSSGKFFWFTHDGKSYTIDDPALVAQILEMYKPMDELGRQQQELGRQQAKLGEQQRQLGIEQRQARVPTPDISREIAEVDAAMAKLKAEKNVNLNQEDLSRIQEKLADLQSRLGDIQGRIGDKMEEFGDKQGHLGELQGKLGEQQGRLGEQQGKLAEEVDRKVKSIINQSLSSGKAKPIQ